MNIHFRKLSALAQVPTMAHEGDAGFDLYAIEAVTIGRHERCVVKTGLAIAIPRGFYGQAKEKAGAGGGVKVSCIKTTHTYIPVLPPQPQEKK